MGLRDNKLLRSKLQVQAKNKFGTGENPPTTDQELTRLEEDIRRLRVEFEVTQGPKGPQAEKVTKT